MGTPRKLKDFSFQNESVPAASETTTSRQMPVDADIKQTSWNRESMAYESYYVYAMRCEQYRDVYSSFTLESVSTRRGRELRTVGRVHCSVGTTKSRIQDVFLP